MRRSGFGRWSSFSFTQFVTTSLTTVRGLLLLLTSIQGTNQFFRRYVLLLLNVGDN